MPQYPLAKHQPLSLRSHPDLTEQWLQSQIANDPSILGLGDLFLIQRERKQDSGGRLDLLLGDATEDRRYEVEIQLGSTDERHIIRCIEYWDVERRRYPQYDHCAVLIAEDITSRFLNILSLFNGQIPLIAIQLSAMLHKDEVILNFVKVVDRVSLRRDDESEIEAAQTDREYWTKKVGQAKVTICDRILELVNQFGTQPYRLNYNKSYIGLADSTRSRNFIHFHVKKSLFRLLVELPESNSEEWKQRFENLDIPVESGRRFLRLLIDSKVIEDHVADFRELIQASVAYAES
ncbi:MAG: hypothetical protein D6692_06700 [Planctomycetota bacterium]|nr:MAG: hypothetical protein D6692_06700 [Planctomycetota bacterium]